MEESLVCVKFKYMVMAYLDFEDSGESHIPAIREYAIFNDGTVIVRDYEAGSGKITNEKTYPTDPHDVVILFSNIKNILDSDSIKKETVVMETDTSNVIFEIHYTDFGHEERCSPMLTDDNGISIMSLIDGYVAYSKKEHTYYNWYSVSLSNFSDQTYSYFYDDDSLKIGDEVIVPVGKDNKEKKGVIVDFWRLSEEKLPFPSEKTKKIIRKVEKPKHIDLLKYLKENTIKKKATYIITDMDGTKQKCSILGDSRKDKESKEPYLVVFTSGGVHCNFVESRILKIDLEN